MIAGHLFWWKKAITSTGSYILITEQRAKYAWTTRTDYNYDHHLLTKKYSLCVEKYLSKLNHGHYTNMRMYMMVCYRTMITGWAGQQTHPSSGLQAAIWSKSIQPLLLPLMIRPPLICQIIASMVKMMRRRHHYIVILLLRRICQMAVLSSPRMLSRPTQACSIFSCNLYSNSVCYTSSTIFVC